MFVSQLGMIGTYDGCVCLSVYFSDLVGQSSAFTVADVGAIPEGVRPIFISMLPLRKLAQAVA